MVETADKLRLDTRTVEREVFQLCGMRHDVGRGPFGSGSVALGNQLLDKGTASCVQASVSF